MLCVSVFVRRFLCVPCVRFVCVLRVCFVCVCVNGVGARKGRKGREAIENQGRRLGKLVLREGMRWLKV